MARRGNSKGVDAGTMLEFNTLAGSAAAASTSVVETNTEAAAEAEEEDKEDEEDEEEGLVGDNKLVVLCLGVGTVGSK